MRLPMPNSLAAAFSPTLLVNLFFAIGVLHYPQKKRRPILSALWAATHVTVYMVFLSMANLMELKEFMGSTIAASNYRFNGYFQTIFISVSMFLSQSKDRVTTKIVIKAMAIDERLRVLGVPRDYDLIFKAQIIQHSVAFSYLFILIVLDFFYVGLDYPSESTRIGFLLFAHYFLVFAYVIDSSYTNSVSYFRNRFKGLNSLLAETDFQRRTEVQLIQESNNQFSQTNSWTYNEIIGNALSIRPTNNQWLLYVTKEIRTIHRDLYNTTVELNQVYATQVLFSITLSFGLITALLYTAYDLAADELSLSLFDIVMTKIASAMWVIYYIAKVVWLVHTCAATSNEAMKTGILIQDLADSAPIYNGDVRDEVSVFILQLIQNPLYFTAGGFFTLDYGLLRKATRRIFRNFITINAQLKTMGIPNDYRLVYKTQIIDLLVGFTFMLVLHVLDLIYIGLDYPDQVSRISLLFAAHHFLTFAFVLDVTYTACVRYLCNRFRRLNSFLTESNLLKTRNILSGRPTNNQWLLGVTKKIRKIHRELCKAAMDFNRANGIQILCSVLLSFGLITSLLYTAYDLEVEAPLVLLSDVVMTKLVTAIWAVYYILKLAWVVNAHAAASSETGAAIGDGGSWLRRQYRFRMYRPADSDTATRILEITRPNSGGGAALPQGCRGLAHLRLRAWIGFRSSGWSLVFLHYRQICIAKAMRTGALIQSLTASTPIYGGDIHDEVCIFTLQLIQNPLTFTAGRLYTLDYSLFQRMIGSVTTYLVIMIQMRSIYETQHIRNNSMFSTALAENTTG
ncbi:uncharacterized protein LOC124414456 [Diprion similis]|uniref:uncharacterized protein LOC124414456 n=1 Tax=Diprion similis TaxID=362088 RepID=UPI001EF8F321|nr:uncharacterized protein LOC124414456 [Diprion similis]